MRGAPLIHFARAGHIALILCLFLAAIACAPTTQPLATGPPSESMMTDEIFITPDGSHLPYRCWLPVGPPTAIMLALHGFNDYSNFIRQTALFLADHGVAVYAYDQRGFGNAPYPGRWPGRSVLDNDLKTVVRLLRPRYPKIPLYLLGESMGGAVIMTALTGSDPPACDGVILAAPAVWSRAAMPWPQRLLLFIAAHTVPWLKVTGTSLNIRASDNDNMLAALSSDPLVIKETRIDTINGLANLMDAAYDASEYFSAPTLLLYGEQDEIIPKKSILHAFQQLPGAATGRQRLLLYKNGYHMLLRDLQADRVRQDINTWLHDPTLPLPSTAMASAVELCCRNTPARDLIPCHGS
jgi:acylglycerol lipase